MTISALIPTRRTQKGEPAFYPRSGTPTVNGLLNAGLLNDNPNAANPKAMILVASHKVGKNAIQPFGCFLQIFWVLYVRIRAGGAE